MTSNKVLSADNQQERLRLPNLYEWNRKILRDYTWDPEEIGKDIVRTPMRIGEQGRNVLAGHNLYDL